jgi:hypothetical protein
VLILLVFITIFIIIRIRVLPALSAFLCCIGGAKFVRPLYAELQVADYHNEVNAIYTKGRLTSLV